MDKEKEIEIATITDIEEIPKEVTDKRVKEEESASKFISGKVLDSPPKTWGRFSYDVAAYTASGIGNMAASGIGNMAASGMSNMYRYSKAPAKQAPPAAKGEEEPRRKREGEEQEQEVKVATTNPVQGATPPPAAPAPAPAEEESATTAEACPATLKIKRLLNKQKRIATATNQATYGQILNAALPNRPKQSGCTYPDIKKDYIALKDTLGQTVNRDINVVQGNVFDIAEEIDKMLVQLYNFEDTNGPLHKLGAGQLEGGKKKGGSKKKKVEKKKERKTKRKSYIKKKKGNSKKNKKSKAKRNTRRK